MSILTDTDIRRILCVEEGQWDDKKLLIKPFDEKCLTPISYDLRVGCFYKTYVSQPSLVTINEGGKIVIKPRDTVLIATYEQIKMPKDGSISALILSKVSQVARGLSQVSTKVDPGWGEGELLIPVQNLSRDIISLDQGDTFCTIIFFKNESAPTSVYNSSLSKLKLVKLLAKTKPESLFEELIFAFVPIGIISFGGLLGYVLFKNTIGLGVAVTASIAISQALSNTILTRFRERK